MLMLSRKEGEQVVINGNIIIKVIRVQCKRVRIAFDAPRETEILRQELADREQRRSA